MNTLLKTTAAVIALSDVFAGPASAAVSKSDLSRSVSSALTSSANINVSESNGVVTLTGQYNDAGDAFSAINAAKSVPGVNKVINLGWQSN